LESKDVAGKLGCSGVVADAGHKPRRNQPSLDPLLMENTVVDILQALVLCPILFLPIWLWAKLKSNTQKIAAPWK